MEALRERFGKYHVLEKIAQGGMAEVYKVKTIGIAGFEKVQALKRILPNSAREGRFIRSFIDEARIAVELTHRNIVQVFDFGKADGELYMAMELIEGKDLRTALAQATTREQPIPVPVAAYLIAEAAGGLDYAHRRTDLHGKSLGIVHCDVSPSNVMLSNDGYVKILDFGIARASFASALERRRLRGKPRYMAPEQTVGEAPTAAADVFALGIIAWELFTGLPLYCGPNLKAILEAVRTTVPPRIDRLNPRVPVEIADAVEFALQREPTARGTAADLGLACTRTAMLAGARALASWLADVDGRHSKSDLPWATLSSSASLQSPSAEHPLASSPKPPPAASLASRLTPFPDLATRPSGTWGVHGASERTSSTTALQRFAGLGRGEGTVTRSAAFPAPEMITRASQVSLSATAQRSIDPTAVTSVSWGHEVTASGVARLADLLPDLLPGTRAPTVPSELRKRPSYEALQLGPGARPSALQFDDEGSTHHSMPFMAPEDTHWDAIGALGIAAPADDGEVVEPSLELELELDDGTDQRAPADLLAEERIDDDDLAGGIEPGERRAVVVSAQLTGAAPGVLQLITRSLGELAYQRGGVVLAEEEAELLIAFGLEVAGEDDVAIAMDWAVAASALVREARADPGTGLHALTSHHAGSPLELRVGARAGVPITAGAALPSDAGDDARALAADARPDRPLVAGVPGRVPGGQFDLRERRAPDAVTSRDSVLEIVGRRVADVPPARASTLVRPPGAFVGRATHLAELEQALRRAVTENRRVAVLISGDAGTGKSRLVAELAHWLGGAAAIRLVATGASRAHQLMPFALVIELYQAALGLPPAHGRAARQQLAQRVTQVLTRGGVAAARAHEIAGDLDRAMELRDGVSLAAPEVADLRPRLSAGLTTFRAASGSERRPQLTILEDLHAADSASLEVLRHALAAPVPGPELLVLTSLPGGSLPPVDLALHLGDLAGPELRVLVADRLGAAATPHTIAAVLARGGNNPLQLEEVARAVRAVGADAPSSARAVIAERIERLSARALATLRYAALLGAVVRVRLLEELLGEDELAAAVDELVRAGFLLRAQPAPGRADDDLEFPGALVHEVVEDTLSERALRENHARIGRLLASRFFAGREEPPAVIADHLERGGEPAGAAAFWLRAGRVALAASDAAAAVACFTRTLVLEHELGAAPATTTSRARRREALAGREEAHRLLGDLAADPGDLDQLELLCDGEPARLADLALRRALRLLSWGDHTTATVATRIAEEHALVAGDERLRGEALRIRAEILERLGRFEEALILVDQARDLFHRVGALTDEMAAMIGRGRIHLLRAQYEAARDAYRPVIAMIEKTGDPWLERIATNHMAVIAMCLGEFTAAMASARRSLDLCRRYGDRAREGDALCVAGIVLLEVGLHAQAAATFAEALELLDRTGSRWSRADCLIYAGMCEVRLGPPARAAAGLAQLDAALSEARALGARYLEANALITRAGAHSARGDLAAAIEDAREGTLAAQQATLVGYEIQGLARHALALVRIGRAAEADALAHRALALLEHQPVLEGSEEEVLAACAEVLRATGAHDQATIIRERGRASAQRKLGAMSDAGWRTAYAARPEIRALLGPGSPR